MSLDELSCLDSRAQLTLVPTYGLPSKCQNRPDIFVLGDAYWHRLGEEFNRSLNNLCCGLDLIAVACWNWRKKLRSQQNKIPTAAISEAVSVVTD